MTSLPRNVRLARAVRLLAALPMLAQIALVQPAFAEDRMSEGQRLALLAKPAVVRVVDAYTAVFTFRSSDRGVLSFQVVYGGMGSGAFINPNGFAVTNAHVVRRTKEGQEAAIEELFLRYCVKLYVEYGLDPKVVLNSVEKQRYVRQYTTYRDVKHYHHVVLPNGEWVPFEIKAFGAPVSQGGKDVAVLKVELKNVPVLRLGNSDTAQPILQVSAPATHGNSGGPVLTDGGEVAGLLTFGGDRVDGQQISGFAFAVPTSTVIEFVKQAGTTNEEGIADARYREGLDLFLEGYFSEAIGKFEEVNRLFPQHSEASRLIRESQQAISEGRERWRLSIPILLGLAGVAVALLLFGGLLTASVATVIAVRASKRPRRPAARPASPARSPHANANPEAPGSHHNTMVLGTMPLGSTVDSTRVH